MTNKYETLTADEVRRMLNYNPETGVFLWADSKSNRAKNGTVAGSVCSRYGYRTIRLAGRLYFASRVAWLYVYGEWPSGLIDHISRDKTDDRICNLRLCNKSQNGANRGPQRNNSLGVKGVRIRKDTGKYTASIGVNGGVRNLGCFDSLEEAHEAYRLASREAFGEFAHTPLTTDT